MNLQKLRKKIDKIDDKILKLLNLRMNYVKKVGILKQNSGEAIYRPERERDILERLKSLNEGLLNQNAIDAIFLEIFAVSRNLESPEKIAFLGPKGSYTHQAAKSRFGAMSSYVAISSIKGVFHELSTKKVKFGVIPIENSSNGIVSDTIDCLSKYEFKIIAEVVLPIHHCFATTCDKISEIKYIYSKDIAFDQCREFLVNFGLDEVELIPVESTTKAAKLAFKKEYAAAIVSHVGAKIYNLPIMFENIEDMDENKTRFFIISDFENAKSGKDKSSILAKFPDRQGALVGFLNDFNKAKINLTKIKSHIVKGDSIFFIDFDGHKEDKKVRSILTKYASNIRFLGSYVKEVNDI